MLNNVIRPPPMIRSLDVKRARRHGQDGWRSRTEVRTGRVHGGRGIQDMANKPICTDKRMNPFVPREKIVLRSKKRNMCYSRQSL